MCITTMWTEKCSSFSMDSKIEKIIKVLAWLEFGCSLMSVTTCVYALVMVSSSISSASMSRKEVAKPSGGGLGSSNYVGTMAIKILYFAILFFVAEACLAIFLIRTLSKKHIAHLRVWLIIASVYCVLYIVDFVSTLHAMSIFEDTSITLGIFVKVPLLILGYKYYTQLAVHGTNLVNESP